MSKSVAPEYARIAANSVAGESAAKMVKAFAVEAGAKESAELRHAEYMAAVAEYAFSTLAPKAKTPKASDILAIVRSEQNELGHDAKATPILSKVSPKATAQQQNVRAIVLILSGIVANSYDTESMTRDEFSSALNMLERGLGKNGKAVTGVTKFTALVTECGLRGAVSAVSALVKESAESVEAPAVEAPAVESSSDASKSESELVAELDAIAERLARMSGKVAYRGVGAHARKVLGATTVTALDTTARVAV